ELGTEYFQFNDGMHELRGERTGMRYRLTDKVQVQVARVDLEARRIEFRLDKGISYESLKRGAAKATDARGNPKPAHKASAHKSKDKPAEAKGQPAKVRRAVASKSTRLAKEARKARKSGRRS